MGFRENNRELIFYVLQFVFWGTLSLTSVLLLPEVGTSYVIYSVLAGVVIGVTSTSLIRWYLKHEISFDGFTLEDFLKVALATLVASVIFGGLNYISALLYVKFGPELSELEAKIFMAMDSFWLIVFSAVFNVALWLGCYLVVKLALRFNANKIERLELNTSLKQAQLNTLKGQINPHFMFNSLNNIRGLMLEDVDKSREMLTKLSEMLRYSLTKNNIDGIALHEELEMVDNYIALSKIQFEDRLQFNSEIAEDCLQLQIPPMLIQLLVENAAKHGISNLKKGGSIDLYVGQKNGSLNIQVKNTGKLQIAKDSTQLGLKNIKQRLKLLYGDRATFSLKESEGHVLANIQIPLK